jgi:MFS family permease
MSKPEKLLSPGYVSLIICQFFGAMNDNVLKGVLTYMVIDGTWKGSLGQGGQGIVGMIFTVPFIFLSGYAGQIADRYSKRNVTWWVKFVEIPIAIIGGFGFWMGNLWITLLSLIALTSQSAFFGPAKYGMIPELVSDKLLSKANGTINMMTNLAVILGTLFAGMISDAYSPRILESSAQVLWLPLAAMLIIAVLGFVVVWFMPPLPAGNPNLAIDMNPVSNYIDTIRDMSKTKLLMVMMAWGYFYLLAGIALLILPEYTMVLDVGRGPASVLLGMLGISVGIGCAVAGVVSGDKIRPRLIPMGAAGLVLFFGLLGWIQPPVIGMKGTMMDVAKCNVSWLVLGAGFSAGFYIVPLQALLQKLSPDDERGRFLGTANGVSFAFLALASLFYWVVRPWFGDSPQRMFLVCSVLMAVGAAFFLWRLRGTKLDAV